MSTRYPALPLFIADLDDFTVAEHQEYLAHGPEPGAIRCLSCQGVYRPFQEDGSLYFHCCPPLSEAEQAEAEQRGQFLLKAGQRRPFARSETSLQQKERLTEWIVYLRNFLTE